MTVGITSTEERNALTMLTKTQTALWVKWIKALKSGKFKQTTEVLKKEIKESIFGHCCLGVACHIVAPEKWKNIYGDGSEYQHDKATNMPSKAVAEKFGLSPEFMTVLANHNDQRKSKKGPYSNVLPLIEGMFEVIKYRKGVNKY